MGDTPAKPAFRITREAILDGSIRAAMAAGEPGLRLPSDEEHRAAIRAMLAARPDGGGDVWLFAYGSLIWNPTIHYAAKEVGTVRGYHRRFCLWSRMGRGTPDNPGLMLGLERGGACRGVLYRIDEAMAAQELEIVWRREMITSAYSPRWVKATTEAGSRWAIAFLINRRHQRYAGGLTEGQVAAIIARASGPLGPCAAYLFNTVAHLRELGITDRPLFRLRDRVAQELSHAGGASG